MRAEHKTRWQLVDELQRLQQRLARLETRRRRCEKDLRDSRQQLQQAQKMETLGTLVAGVAHEINNPLNLIIYNLPLLKKIWTDLFPLLRQSRKVEPERKFGGFSHDFLEDNLGRMIADMDLAANRMAKTVADLKRFSRQSNVAEKIPVQLNTAVHNAMRLSRAALSKASVKTELFLAEDLPPIEANPQSLEQVIINILINAVEAIDHPHGKIIITTGLQAKDGRVYVRIADNGRGVAPEIADRIFLPFVSDKNAQGGTGLGLSVTHSLVQAHGGEIDFESRPEQGSEFTVYLPCQLERQAVRILVVDDDAGIRRMLIEALSMDRRFLVQEASNGLEASIKLGTYRPDLLILDIFMPTMDGLELCRIIRSEPELSSMKVIITTGYPDHPKLHAIGELGFAHVIYKPFKIGDLAAEVKKVLERSRQAPT